MGTPKKFQKNATRDILDKGEAFSDEITTVRNAAFGVSQLKNQPALTTQQNDRGCGPFVSIPLRDGCACLAQV